MHELSIADALVKQVEGIVAREGAARAISITVEVGAFSGVDPDALSAAFPFVAEDSPVVGKATLKIIATPASVKCRECGANHEDATLVACVKCGSANLTFNGRRDLTFRNVELEFET